MSKVKSNNEIYKIKENYHSFDGIFLKKDEKFSPIIDPTYYLMLLENKDARITNSASLNENIYLISLQNKIHYLFEYFLNSYNLLDPLSNTEPDKFPLGIVQPKNLHFLVTKITKEFKFRFSNLSKVLENIDNSSETISSQIVSKILASYNKDFESIVDSLSTSKKLKIKTMPSLNDEKYLQRNPNVGKKIVYLNHYVNNELQNFIEAFFIHGSLATEDYVEGCSDCDTFAILKKESVTNDSKLLQLKEKIYEIWKIFYQIDKLQHHGIFFSNEIEMNYYPQSYFPIILFDYSKCLYGKNESFTFYERDSSIERKNTLWNITYYFRSKFLNDNYPSDIYLLKEFFQVLLLTPTIFLQLNGDYLYKKYSFDKIKSYFKSEELKILNFASESRMKNIYFNFMDKTKQRILDSYLTGTNHESLIKYRTQSRIPITKEQLEKQFGIDILYESFQFAEKILSKSKIF